MTTITYNKKIYPVNIIKNPIGITVQVEYADGDHREFYFKDGKYDATKVLELLDVQVKTPAPVIEQSACPVCGRTL